MRIELEDDPVPADDVSELCERVRAAAARNSYAPEVVVELGTWLRARNDDAYRRVLECAVSNYAGQLLLVAHVLGLSLSAVYGACKRFGIPHGSPMAGTTKVREPHVQGYGDELEATGTAGPDFFLDHVGSHKIYKGNSSYLGKEPTWRRLNTRSREILESTLTKQEANHEE